MDMTTNSDLARIFFEMADVLELKGVDWKPNAYRKVAKVLETLQEPIEAIYARKGIAGLKDLPGVGESSAEKIEEFLKTGRVKEHDSIVKKIPAGVEEMMHVPSLGPKKAMRLFKELKIKNAGDLEKAAKEGRIRELEGFGEKSEADILRGLELKK